MRQVLTAIVTLASAAAAQPCSTAYSPNLEWTTGLIPGSGVYGVSVASASFSSVGNSWTVQASGTAPLFLFLGASRPPFTPAVSGFCSAESSLVGLGSPILLATGQTINATVPLPPFPPSGIGLGFSGQLGYLEPGCFGLGPTSFSHYSRRPICPNTFVPNVGERCLHGESSSLFQPAVVTGASTQRYMTLISKGYLQPLPPSGGTLVYTIGSGAGATFPAERAYIAKPLLEPLSRLQQLVQRDYGSLGWKLRISSPLRYGSGTSLHYAGRSLDFLLSSAQSADVGRYGELANLALEAGFLWVYNEHMRPGVGPHVHASLNTGGPDIRVVRVLPPTAGGSPVAYTWPVTVSVSDPEGVLELYAHITAKGEDIAWENPPAPCAALGTSIDQPVHSWATTSPAQPWLPTEDEVTINVSAPPCLFNMQDEVTLHLWARDSFGSVQIDAAATAKQYPMTTKHTLAKAQTITLGVLPGDTQSEAWAVSADGSVVVGISGNGFTFRGFRWSDGVMSEIPGPPGTTILHPLAVSADGSVIAGRMSDSQNSMAFRWTAATGTVSLGTMPGHDSSNAYGISADGSTIVGSSYSQSSSAQLAYRWTVEDGMVPLPLEGGTTSIALGISGDGSTIFGHIGAGSGSTVRWIEGSVVPFGSVLGSSLSWVTATNFDGSVVIGGFFDALFNERGFRWEGGNAVNLSVLPSATQTQALGVNGDGEVVCGRSWNAVMDWGYRWLENPGIQPLPGIASSSRANAVSDDGAAIVGTRNLRTGPRAALWR